VLQEAGDWRLGACCRRPSPGTEAAPVTRETLLVQALGGARNRTPLSLERRDDDIATKALYARRGRATQSKRAGPWGL